MGSLSTYLYKIVNELKEQKYSTSTIHKVLYSLRDSLDISAAVLVIRNQQTGKLEINNRYNIADRAARTFYREIGNNVIGRIWYHDEIILTSHNGPVEDYKDIYLDVDYKTALTVRIEAENQTRGYLTVYFDKETEADKEQIMFLKANAAICSFALMQDQYRRVISSLRQTDSYTGLLIYNFFHQKLEEEFERSTRYNIPLTTAIMRIDDFVDILELCGTDIAQTLYKEVADDLRTLIRGIDVLGSMGRDEFILYMPSTTHSNAEIVFNRFKEMTESKKYTLKEMSISITIGATTLFQNDTLVDLINRLKISLHNAIIKGRGSVCLLSD